MERGAFGEAVRLSAATLVVFTLVSAAGLLRVLAGHSWIGPVAATALVAHLVPWLARRWKVGPVLTVIGTAVALVLTVSWTVLGPTTRYGLPLAGTWTHAVSALQEVGEDIAASTPPVAPTTDLVLLCALIAAVIAVLGDTLAFHLRKPLAALVPGFAGFIACGVAGRGAGRPALVAVQVAAACMFLLADRQSAPGPHPWLAGARSGGMRWAVGAGAATSLGAVAVAALVLPALPRSDGSAALGWNPGTDSNRVIPNPLVSIQTQLHTLAHQPVFEVQAETASYWRLTSLNNFDGNAWSGTFSPSAFGSRLPGASSLGKGTTEESATFEIEDLDSPWLPDQFSPVSVSGVTHVAYDRQSNSLITSHSTSNGQSYTVTSYRYLASLSAVDLERAPSTTRDPAAAQDIELPASIPGSVTDLAKQITANKHSQYAKALAIQDYLRGPQFSYSLNPPSDGTGEHALTNFLFVTRTGYCQQYAGAFAVLARAAGIPTRLAVGYATGTDEGGGLYQVTGADAHTWPEVYFGTGVGWVPFEPTPGYTVPDTTRYDRTSGGEQGQPSSPTTASSGQNDATGPGRALPKSKAAATTTPKTAAPVLPVTTAAHSSASAWWWLLAVPGLVGLLLVWVLGVAAAKRLCRLWSRRRAIRQGSDAVVLDAWDEVTEELSWVDLERAPAETLDEFTARAMRAVRGGEVRSRLVDLSGLAGRAVYAASVSDDEAQAAVYAAARVRHGLRSTESAGERLSRSVSPRRRRSADASGGSGRQRRRPAEKTTTG